MYVPRNLSYTEIFLADMHYLRPNPTPGRERCGIEIYILRFPAVIIHEIIRES